MAACASVAAPLFSGCLRRLRSLFISGGLFFCGGLCFRACFGQLRGLVFRGGLCFRDVLLSCGFFALQWLPEAAAWPTVSAAYDRTMQDCVGAAAGSPSAASLPVRAQKGMQASQAVAMVDAQQAAEAANAARQAADQRSILVQGIHFAATEQIVAAHFGWVLGVDVWRGAALLVGKGRKPGGCTGRGRPGRVHRRGARL